MYWLLSSVLCGSTLEIYFYEIFRRWSVRECLLITGVYVEHTSEGAAVSMSACEHADVCVAKHSDEKGKCAVIGTCRQQKVLNFQYSS